ncbi:Hsp70 family protein [Hamadaea tsunoensis]|uniref:Hsp70 family protein n=1 Tax=Hamadaea tsunoensis TaxID=53368 RepID=UPI000405C1F9|nr:hypothetical protein [Hamadaea tsunoensis]
MSDTMDTQVIGFDLGHGETALTVVQAREDAAPRALSLTGAQGKGRQHITAVAVHPTRGVLVGESAITDGTTQLYLAFKSPHLDDPAMHVPTRLLVETIVADVTGKGSVRRDGARRWVFGAPSGWDKELLKEYAKLLAVPGLDDPYTTVEVVPESRAALLYARDSGEVPVTAGQLSGSVLIVDVGSSTTDFTSVVKRRMAPSDRGTALGAGLIEQTMLRRAIEASPQRAEIEDALGESPFQRLRLEVFCRRIKEEYFLIDPADLSSPNSVIIKTYKLITRTGAVYFPIEVGEEEMTAILATPQPALGGRSWPEAFRDDLMTVAAGLADPPDSVLLTGGASRMTFVQEITRTVFGPDRTLLGSEPEVAIARGLALAGRIGVRAGGFRSDITSLTTGTGISLLVADRLPDLAQRLGAGLTEGMTERYVIPAFQQWRSGRIKTLRDMAAQVASEMRADITRPNNPKVNRIISDWQDEMQPALEALTRPICNRWRIPPAAMALQRQKVSGSTEVDLAPNITPGTEAIGTMATAINTVVLGILGTWLLTSTGAIVLAMGPVGAVVAFVAAMVTLVIGREAALEKAQTSNLPLWMRQLKSEEGLVQRLKSSASVEEGRLALQLANEFLEKEGPNLGAKIAADLALRLEAQAREAELLIS